MKRRVKELSEKRNVSVKWIIFACLLGMCALLLVVMWFFQTVYLNNSYKYIKKKELKEGMNSLVSVINESDLNDAVTSVSENYDVCILVLDESANSLYSADNHKNCVIHRWDRATLLQYISLAQENNDTYEETIDNSSIQRNGKYGLPSPNLNNSVDNRFDDMFQKHDEQKAESVVYIKNVVTDNDGTYTIMLNSTITPVDATVRTIRFQLIYITLMAGALALILAFVISRKISKPIIKINDSAKHLAKGEFDTRFDAGGYKEIAELSDTLTKAAVELGKTDKMQQELLANVSHDLRTPLTMIVGYSEVMRDIPGENSAENVQVIIDEAKRLTGLVNDLLDMSKMQAGVSDYKPELYDLTESTKAIVDRIDRMVDKDGYNVDFQYKENVLVNADEHKIYQVIYNLIGNAINYTGEDKKVIIKQTVEADKVRISVIDTGAGISEEDKIYVWQRYYKIDKTHKRAIVGNGLGLSIVQNVLKLHGAAYGVDSELGKGSTFWFELPAVK